MIFYFAANGSDARLLPLKKNKKIGVLFTFFTISKGVMKEFKTEFRRAKLKSIKREDHE